MRDQPRQPDRRITVKCEWCGSAVDLVTDGVDEHGGTWCLACRLHRTGFEQGERIAACEGLFAHVRQLLDQSPFEADEIREIVEEALAGKEGWIPGDDRLADETRTLREALASRNRVAE